MAGRDGPPPSAADDLPDLVAEAHAAQLQFVSSLPAAGHGGHGGGARGSTLGLGDGGRGSTRGRGSHGTGRGRAQGGGPGQGDGQPLGRGRPVPGDVQGDGPPLGSSRAGQPSGHGDDAQHAAAGDPNHPFRASRPATTNQTKKKMNESDSMDWNDEYIALVLSRVQQQSEKMDDQQSELEDLKLKFQESEAARENHRGQIEARGETFWL